MNNKLRKLETALILNELKKRFIEMYCIGMKRKEIVSNILYTAEDAGASFETSMKIGETFGGFFDIARKEGWKEILPEDETFLVSKYKEMKEGKVNNE